MKTTQKFEEIEKNLPTCIPNVDWEKAYQDHVKRLVKPTAQCYPRVYQLETTSLCNLNCVMCPRRKMTRPRQLMEEKLFRTIVERDLIWTKAVELFGFGEPFTDPLIGERIKYLHHYEIKVTIATNGLLAHRLKDSEIASIDYLVYDVDALTKDKYEEIRIGGNYELMMENLNRVLAIRNKAEHKRYTVLQFIDIEGDEKLKKDFIKRYEGKADEIRIKFLDTFAGQVGEADNYHQKSVCCQEPLYGVSIWSNGDVVICDRDFDSVHKVGNLHDSDLAEIWSGKEMAIIQAMHLTRRGEALKLCSQCKEWKLTNLRNVPELTVNMFRGGFV